MHARYDIPEVVPREDILSATRAYSSILSQLLSSSKTSSSEVLAAIVPHLRLHECLGKSIEHTFSESVEDKSFFKDWVEAYSDDFLTNHIQVLEAGLDEATAASGVGYSDLLGKSWEHKYI